MWVVVLIESVVTFLAISVIVRVLKHRIIEIGIFEHQFGL